GEILGAVNIEWEITAAASLNQLHWLKRFAEQVSAALEREPESPAAPPPANRPSRPEALAKIELIRGDLLELQVDALVIPTVTGQTPTVGLRKLVVDRLPSSVQTQLQRSPRMALGETVVTPAAPWPARYLIFTRTGERTD